MRCTRSPSENREVNGVFIDNSRGVQTAAVIPNSPVKDMYRTSADYRAAFQVVQSSLANQNMQNIANNLAQNFPIPFSNVLQNPNFSNFQTPQNSHSNSPVSENFQFSQLPSLGPSVRMSGACGSGATGNNGRISFSAPNSANVTPQRVGGFGPRNVRVEEY